MKGEWNAQGGRVPRRTLTAFWRTDSEEEVVDGRLTRASELSCVTETAFDQRGGLTEPFFEDMCRLFEPFVQGSGSVDGRAVGEEDVIMGRIQVSDLLEQMNTAEGVWVFRPGSMERAVAGVPEISDMLMEQGKDSSDIGRCPV